VASNGHSYSDCWAQGETAISGRDVLCDLIVLLIVSAVLPGGLDSERLLHLVAGTHPVTALLMGRSRHGIEPLCALSLRFLDAFSVRNAFLSGSPAASAWRVGSIFLFGTIFVVRGESKRKYRATTIHRWIFCQRDGPRSRTRSPLFSIWGGTMVSSNLEATPESRSPDLAGSIGRPAWPVGRFGRTFLPGWGPRVSWLPERRWSDLP